MKKEKLRTLL